MIINPILPGFNPDPSIVRVGEDYYIATSTFEWYPGVQIHHSRDLVNWTLVRRPLERKSQLDMRGNRITSALIGASSPVQVEDCVRALDKRDFTADELAEIDAYAREADINLWAASAERKGPARKTK